jgi:diketogulonate reductase-like aldo/keto reductase
VGRPAPPARDLRLPARVRNAIGPDPVVVIPGASSIAQLEANAAADVILSRDEQQALTAAAREVQTPGSDSHNQ